MTSEKGIAFAGLGIQLTVGNRVIFSQKQYVSELPTMDIAQYANRKKVANIKDPQRTFRQGLVALIRVRRTRPDVGFLVTKITTDLMNARADAGKSTQLAKWYNKTVRFFEESPRRDSLRPPPQV